MSFGNSLAAQPTEVIAVLPINCRGAFGVSVNICSDRQMVGKRRLTVGHKALVDIL